MYSHALTQFSSVLRQHDFFRFEFGVCVRLEQELVWHRKRFVAVDDRFRSEHGAEGAGEDDAIDAELEAGVHHVGRACRANATRISSTALSIIVR